MKNKEEQCNNLCGMFMQMFTTSHVDMNAEEMFEYAEKEMKLWEPEYNYSDIQKMVFILNTLSFYGY